MASLSDEMWARFEPLLPPAKNAVGRRCASIGTCSEVRSTADRTGFAWPELPAEFGPGRPSGRATTAAPPLGPRTRSWPRAGADRRKGWKPWRLSVDSTSAKVRHHGATVSGW